MGELLPCPFCGGDAVVVNDGQASFMVGCTSPACGICNAARDFTSEAEAISAWNTRPRTEGRGEGEPVAYMMKTAGSGHRPVLASYVDAWREKGVEVDAQPLYASPIREPEISRTALIETMRQHIKADAVGLAPAVIAHYLVGFEEAADAILNLAPVGGRGEEGSSSRADLSPASRSPDQHSDGEGW